MVLAIVRGGMADRIGRCDFGYASASAKQLRTCRFAVGHPWPG
jgi:hypothetical protein